MDRKKILIISATNQDSDPRVLRQIEFLKDDFDVYCCGVSNSIVSPDRFIRLNYHQSNVISKMIIGVLKLSGFYETAENYVLNTRLKTDTVHSKTEFDLIIANDFDTLAMSFKKFGTKKTLADFHEYAPSEFEDKLYWKFVNKKFVIHQCKKYFPKLDEITTVCESIASEYESEFGRKPVVITNAAGYNEIEPSPIGDKIKIIHHGAAISSRKIELMIETARLLDDRFLLDLMLIPNEINYYEKLKRMISVNDKVKIINPVAYKDIITFSGSYDIGLFILPYANLNYRYALPNKFFEYIQSRLAIITGPSPEMSKYIDEYGLGIHTDSFEPAEIAGKINDLTKEKVEAFKKNCHLNARQLSSEKSKNILVNLVNKII